MRSDMELVAMGPSASTKPTTMSQRRILKNLLVVCLGFFFLFSSWQALANLQSTLNLEVGVVSQSVVYAALIASALLLPKLLIRRLGCKRTLAFSALTYAPYMAVNLYPRLSTFVPASLLVGMGAAPLWAAKCTYLNQLSALYAAHTDDTEVVTSRFFGVFFMFFQGTQVFGNLVSFVVLRPSADVSWNASDNVTCGAGFCSGSDDDNSNLRPPSQEKRFVLIGIYVALTLVSAAVLGAFLDPLPQKGEEEGAEEESVLSRVSATLRHLKKVDQLLLVPITVFSGVEQAFILGDFTKAYVGCAWGVHNVGLVFICFGVVNAGMSLAAGRLGVSRAALVGGAAAGNAAVCVALLLWRPSGQQPFVFFLLIGVWGASDAVWQTQINALHGILFRSNEEAAFANYRLWESFGFSVAFCCSMFLCMTPKIIIVLAFLFVGVAGYSIVEIRNRKRKSFAPSS